MAFAILAGGAAGAITAALNAKLGVNRLLSGIGRLFDVERHGGIFPNDLEALRALPGIGDYTAAAVAAIAFDAPAVPVDGNVERVVSRLFAVEESLPTAKASPTTAFWAS